MKRNILWILLALATAVQAASPAPAPIVLQPDQTQAEAAAVSARLLSRYHYEAMPLDDRMSEKIFDRYLKSLDPERVFFLQADIDQFSAARTLLDDAIAGQQLGTPFAIYTRYVRRVQERLSLARELLDKGFDFGIDEQYRYVRTDLPWAASEAEIDDIWRKRVKNDWLRLKLAGKDETEIRSTLDRRYETALTRSSRAKSSDVFQVFMNAYAASIEPHTSYLGPRASEDFAIAMKLSLVGIGAVLQERDDYVTIRELVAGGPASRSERLAVGDRIAGVAQAENTPFVDVVGWRVDDVVGMIRGEKGTTVVLDILPADAGPDAEHKQVVMVRDTINLEKQAASKSILELGSGDARKRVGVITLPTFYQDVDARRNGDDNYRSASRDVARLLSELKDEAVDGVLIDLRNNGGGSLDEAIALTGLFIHTGPVVQQRNAQGQIRIERDLIPGQAWSGPLGVLINRASASASEIFAAAVQDYGRGLIIGEQSFGKGTVQTLLDLDEMADSKTPTYGELKMTVAQFFRVSGGTTQLKGVTPDIALPSLADKDNFGESSYDNALPWTQVEAAPFTPEGQFSELLPTLTLRHEARITNDIDYRNLEEDVAELDTLRKRNEISLNENERRRERSMQETRLKAREVARAAAAGSTGDKAGPEDIAALRDDGLVAGERSLRAELDAEKSGKNRRDVLLDEAGAILGDMVELLQADTGLAARTPPAAGARVN